MISRLIGATRVGLMGVAMAAALAPAVTQAEDNSVKRKLDSMGQKYEIDKDGDFKMTFKFSEDNRTQVVFVSGKVEEAAPLMIRQVFGPVANVEDDNIKSKALDLLRDNFGLRIGAYEISGDYLIFNVKLHDGASVKELEKAIHLVAGVADEKEKEISGTRDTY
ncbi:MAG: hypothetical protein ABL914_08250 [Novosphingobium sp.]|uniref:hypothetical protein n=1 Tax=Novosphingobium sp. TaxID=1874826 RepID=UPI0032BB5E0B